MSKAPQTIDVPASNFNDRPPGMPIDMLIVHSISMPTLGEAMNILTGGDPALPVSCHYVVDEDGTIYKLVEESKRAWHAGVSFWGAQTGLNDRTIGIELINLPTVTGYNQFPDVQMMALANLCQGILERHPIAPERVLAHSDIAPTRKEDPREHFDWKWMAGQGVGIWPDLSIAAPTEPLETLLARYGYQTGDSTVDRASTVAFQRHFRPGKVDGVADEECRRLADALCRQTGALQAAIGPRDVPVVHHTP